MLFKRQLTHLRKPAIPQRLDTGQVDVAVADRVQQVLQPAGQAGENLHVRLIVRADLVKIFVNHHQRFVTMQPRVPVQAVALAKVTSQYQQHVHFITVDGFYRAGMAGEPVQAKRQLVPFGKRPLPDNVVATGRRYFSARRSSSSASCGLFMRLPTRQTTFKPRNR